MSLSKFVQRLSGSFYQPWWQSPCICAGVASRHRCVLACTYRGITLISVLRRSKRNLPAGAAGLQRLAARLIPRFAAQFPLELERSAQVLADLVRAQPPDTARSAAETATLQDALKGLGFATAKLCQLSPGHAALQEALELLFRCVKAMGGRQKRWHQLGVLVHQFEVAFVHAGISN